MGEIQNSAFIQMINPKFPLCTTPAQPQPPRAAQHASAAEPPERNTQPMCVFVCVGSRYVSTAVR